MTISVYISIAFCDLQSPLTLTASPVKQAKVVGTNCISEMKKMNWSSDHGIATTHSLLILRHLTLL